MVIQKVYSPKEAQDRFNTLPADIRELLYSTDMSTILSSVGAKHKLHVDQIGRLEEETGSVMLGFTEPQDYPRMVSEAVGVDDATAADIVRDMNELLFSKIRESMQKLPKNPDAKSGSDLTPKTEQDYTSPETVLQQSIPSQQSSRPKPEYSIADMLLTQKTSTVVPPTSETASAPTAAALTTQTPVSPSTPPAMTPPPPTQTPISSRDYKTDPYHEPIE